MATTMLLCGIPTLMAQNVVFALPSQQCVLFCSTAGPTFQQSNDPAFGDNAAITLTAGVSNSIIAGFIRNTNAATATAILKRAI